jgi:hypothetical protein
MGLFGALADLVNRLPEEQVMLEEENYLNKLQECLVELVLRYHRPADLDTDGATLKITEMELRIPGTDGAEDFVIRGPLDTLRQVRMLETGKAEPDPEGGLNSGILVLPDDMEAPNDEDILALSDAIYQDLRIEMGRRDRRDED